VTRQFTSRAIAISLAYRRIILNLAAVLVTAPLVYLVLHQALALWHYRIRVPYWDMIGIVSQLDGHPSPGVLDLYRTVRDNEHRPIVTFLFYLWDRNYFNDSGELLYRAMMVANVILVFSFLAILVPVRRTIDLSYRVLLGVTVTFSFFAIYHYENLTWQKQVHEISCMTFLSLGFLLAALVSTRDSPDRNAAADILLAILAGIFCFAATYSFGFGLAAWPVVLAHALLRGWKPWPLFAFAAFAIFAVVTYSLTYVILQHHTNPIRAVSSPFDMMIYALHVIGAPAYYIFESLFSNKVARLLASIVGLAGCIMAGVQIVLLYSGKKLKQTTRQRRVVSFHATMWMFAAFGMSIMLALGRLTINDGLDSRYAIVGALFWSSLLVLLVSSLQRRAAYYCILFFGVAALAAAYLPARRYESLLRVREQSTYQAGVMATLRLHFWPRMPALYPHPSPLFEVWHRERPPGGSFAQREPFKWISTSLTGLPQAPISSRCLSHIDAVTRLTEDQRVAKISGWAFIAAQDTRLHWIVATDAAGTGVGAGVAGLERPDVRNHFKAEGIDANTDDQRSSGFEIAIVSEPGNQIQLWGIDLEGRACRLEDLTSAWMPIESRSDRGS
jgi:hypothetical protein